MLLTEIPIKKAYSSDDSDILNDFYIPALECSCDYKRLTGYFSSKSLAISLRGLKGLVRNNGTIKLIASPYFSKEDIKVITDNTLNDRILSDSLIRSMNLDEESLNGDNLKILAYLLKTFKLEIKIAIILNEKNVPLSGEEIETRGIFHQKVGILTDINNNVITFSGSINETAAAWKSNIEEFKVFRNWEEEENDYVVADILKFNKYWNGQAENIKIYNLPSAVKENILKRNSSQSHQSKFEYNKEDQLEQASRSLFDYQEKAILSWQLNNYIGIFEMATGTGKTFTALNCYLQLFNDKGPFVSIISCPFNHLLVQWEKEIKKIDPSCVLLLCDSSNPQWKEKLLELLTSYLFYKKFRLAILTTHATLANINFRSCVERFSKIPFFLIADEVHGLGATVSQKGLLNIYKYRLGLSATPKRWFDQDGTDYIYNYFDKVVFEFSLREAITLINPLTSKTYLTPFYYHTEFVNLDENELEEYLKFTNYIIRRSSSYSNDDNELLTKMLIFKRANIVKNCSNKLLCLERILESIKRREGNLFGTIVYCTPKQINNVIEILNTAGIIFNKITMHEGTTPTEEFGGISEREYILNNFSKGTFEILVAIKCLDEGVDIPQAKNAIILASSGNPREYIQRIGRVIRRFEEKSYANIFDIIVSPSSQISDEIFIRLERKIFTKELNRVKDIAINALNNIEVMNVINNQLSKVL